MRRPLTLAAAIAAFVALAGTSLAQTGAERPAVERGVTFLKGQIENMDSGMAGIAALALIKTGLPPNDPGIAACLGKIAPSFQDGGYKPLTNHAQGLYEASVVVLALVNIAHEDYKPQIDAASQYIIGRQLANGGWDYTERTQGDESVSQYCLLALWEAENAGIIVPPQVWDRAAAYYLSVQAAGGSWTYHRDSPNQGETISMTAAGIGSLMLCEEQLARYRKGQDLVNPLMLPITIDGQPAESRYKVQTKPGEIKNGVAKGLSWLAANFKTDTSPVMGQSPYYALYGIERLIALGGGDKDVGGKSVSVLGDIQWYKRGLDLVLNAQKPTGAWEAQHEPVPNTCWAILFSVRATKISIKKINLRKLSGGQLRAGETLPSDLNNVEVIGGQLVAKPMGGAIEGMLKVLEDVRADNTDSALAGLVNEYQKNGPKVIRPLKDRFRKLLRDQDGSIRLIAAWFLGRTGDLDVAPDLIKALLDDDDEVVAEARTGLLVLSRKLEGFGPENKSTPEQKQEAAKRWRDWFEAVKPPDLDAPVDILPAPPATPGAAPAPAADAPKGSSN